MTDLLPPRRAGAPPGRPPVHPRIARRWAEARREEGRRRLRVLAGAGGVATLAGLAVASLFSPIFAVRHVRVSLAGPGVTPFGTPPAPVFDAAGLRRLAGLGGSPLMIDVDAPAAVRRLDANPWLGGARVARRWPATVTVAATERTPMAVAATPAGTWAEIDATGRVLAVLASRPTVLAQLQVPYPVPAPGGWLPGTPGPAAPPGAPPGALVDMSASPDRADVPSGAGAALAVLADLPALLRSQVSEVSVGGPGSGLSLTISPPDPGVGTVAVSFGDGSQLQAKVTALETLVSQGQLAGVTALDLSVPDRPAATTSALAGSAP